MIAFLEGTVVEKGGDRVVLSVGGVELPLVLADIRCHDPHEILRSVP